MRIYREKKPRNNYVVVLKPEVGNKQQNDTSSKIFYIAMDNDEKITSKRKPANYIVYLLKEEEKNVYFFYCMNFSMPLWVCYKTNRIAFRIAVL